MRQWEKEKAEGCLSNFEDEEISGEVQEKSIKGPEIDEVEVPPVPIPVIRY